MNNCMRMSIPVLVAMLLAVFIGGCSKPASIHLQCGSQVRPCSSVDANTSDDKFSFAIISDLHGGGRTGVFPVAVKCLNQMQPDLVMSVGDLISGYIDDVEAIAAQWDEFDAMASKLEMPFFYVPGNHDMTNSVMADVWKRRLGASYYHFVYKNVLFVGLNTEDGNATTISPKQVEYVRRALSENDTVRWTFLFMHKPLWDYADQSGFAEIEAALQGRKYSVYAGHYHCYIKFRRNDADYYVLSTTGGGSPLRGDLHGEFDHFVWVTMDSDGPTMTNILLDGMRPDDVTTEQMNKLTYNVSRRGVSVSSILTESDVLSGSAGTKVKLNNPTEIPVTFAGSFTSEDGFKMQPDTFNVQLAGGQSSELPVELSYDGEISVEDIAPIKLNWKATANIEGREKPIELPGSCDVYVEKIQSCTRAESPVSVDGDLSEWAALNLSMDSLAGGSENEYAANWSGPMDASCTFAARYDDDYLYAAVKVCDEEIYTTTRQQFWQQDSIELWLDVRPKDQRMATQASSSKLRRVCGIAAGSVSKNAPEGYITASKITDIGYDVEIAVPIKYLTELQGENWDGFRMNLVQFDTDGEEKLQMWWKPSWRSGSAPVGAGAFVRK